MARSGRALGAVIGPWAQVVAAHEAVGLSVPTEGRELLFALDLERLRVPAALGAGEVRCTRTRDSDLELATRWSVAYGVETLGDTPGPALETRSAGMTADLHGLGRSWLLWADGSPVAYTAFNAVLPDTVQIGGVYTPPAFRSRGHARAAVAASLLEARAAGVRRAVLFTDTANLPAQRAYVSLGFEQIGDYGLVFLRD
jgi:predicted GNAT family acetyltransferase